MPEIDGGRFPAKRVVGETVVVEADIFADGHETLAAVLKYKRRTLPRSAGMSPASGVPAESKTPWGKKPGDGAGAELDNAWTETPMAPLVNDRWRGEFPVTELGRYAYTIEAWVDHFETWSRRLAKRLAAGQDVRLELEVGARMLEETASAAGRAQGAIQAGGGAADAARLRELAKSLRARSPRATESSPSDRAAVATPSDPAAVAAPSDR